MKLKGQIVDKLRDILGGKTPTEKRIEKLLDEVESLRGQKLDRAAADMATEIPDDGSAVVSVEVGTTAAEAFIPPTGPFSRAGVPSEETDEPPAEEEIPQTERQIMMAAIKQLEARIAELAKPRTAEEKEEAIGAGRLPVVIKDAPPVGYTGSAQLPRGRWFASPYGPPIKMKLCDCSACSPFRLQHYFCVTCQRGPIDYQQKNPQGRKIWLAPGATWGISHECCSVVCYMRYMETIGIVAGVNDFQAPGQPAAEGAPERPVMVPGSD